MVKSELLSASEGTGIEIDRDTLTGESTDSEFNLRYEWFIESHENSYELIEKQYIQRSWFYFFASSFFFLATGFVFGSIQILNTPESPFLGYNFFEVNFWTSDLAQLYILISGAIFGMSMIAYFYYSGLVRDTRGATEGYVSYSPHDFSIICFMLGGVIGGIGFHFGFASVTMVSAISLYSLFFLLAYDNTMFEDRSKWLRSVNPVFRLPPVAGEYMLAVIAAILIPADIVILTVWLGDYIILLFLHSPFLFIISILLLHFLLTLSSRSALDLFHDVRQRRKEETRTVYQALFFCCTVLLSYLLVITLTLVLAIYGEALLAPAQYPRAGALAVIAILPASYFFIGMLYQTVHGVKEKISLFNNSTPLNRSDTPATVLKTRFDKSTPASLSTGFGDYIFIPSSVEEHLDDEEIDAIIAHEEKHIRSKEALLFFFIPIVSILLVTGQNVIYSLLDFHEREFAADKYAKEKVGEEAVVSALQEMSDFIESDREETDWWQDHFNLFFGTFAYSEAHPDIEDRIDRLRSEE